MDPGVGLTCLGFGPLEPFHQRRAWGGAGGGRAETLAALAQGSSRPRAHLSHKRACAATRGAWSSQTQASVELALISSILTGPSAPRAPQPAGEGWALTWEKGPSGLLEFPKGLGGSKEGSDNAAGG